MHDHVNCLNAHAHANGLKCTDISKLQTCTNQVEEEKFMDAEDGSTDNYERDDMDNQ